MTIDVSSNNIFERIMIDELSVARICLISPRGIASGRFYLFAGKAETPLPMLIVGNVRSEVFGAVIGPICRCDNKFGISYLIEEEVAHTHISTCANKQVRVGNSDVVSAPANAASSISSGASVPSATLRASLRAASIISQRAE